MHQRRPGNSAPPPRPVRATLAAEAAIDPYDAVPYPVQVHEGTHPHRLATLGRAFGLAPSDPATCRIVELGCATAANLCAIAASLPGATCVGVERSVVQVEQARARVAALGLGNVTLVQADLTALPELGRFDYVVAHGVLSWVPPEVGRALLDVCRALLEPTGLAYVSYNVNPGWLLHAALRGAARFHTRNLTEPGAKVAQTRALLRFMAQATDAATGAGQLWRELNRELAPHSDGYLFHDHLEPDNHPLWLYELVALARRAGLRYVADVDLSLMLPDRVADDVAAVISQAGTRVEIEQYLDLVESRSFRRSVLCHADRALSPGLDWRCARDLWVSSHYQPRSADPDLVGDGVETFEDGDGSLDTSISVVKLTFAELARRGPASVPVAELVARAEAVLGGDQEEAVCAALLTAWLRGAVKLYTGPDLVCAEVVDRPMAFGPARLEASRGASAVSDVRLQSFAVDSLDRTLLPLLDGTRGAAELVAAATVAVHEGRVVLPDAAAGVVHDDVALATLLDHEVRSRLDAYRRSCLLIQS